MTLCNALGASFGGFFGSPCGWYLYLYSSRALFEESCCQGMLPCATVTFDSDVADVGLRPMRGRWSAMNKLWRDARYAYRSRILRDQKHRTWLREGPNHQLMSAEHELATELFGGSCCWVLVLLAVAEAVDTYVELRIPLGALLEYVLSDMLATSFANCISSSSCGLCWHSGSSSRLSIEVVRGWRDVCDLWCRFRSSLRLCPIFEALSRGGTVHVIPEARTRMAYVIFLWTWILDCFVRVVGINIWEPYPHETIKLFVA